MIKYVFSLKREENPRILKIYLFFSLIISCTRIELRNKLRPMLKRGKSKVKRQKKVKNILLLFQIS